MKKIVLLLIILIGLCVNFLSLPPLALLLSYSLLAGLMILFMIVEFDLVMILGLWIIVVPFSAFMGAVELSISLTFDRLLWLLLIYGILSRVMFKKLKWQRFNAIDSVMFAFIIYCVLSLFIGKMISEQSVDLQKLLNAFIIPFSIFWVAKYLVVTQRDIKKIFLVLIGLGVYLSIIAVFEHYSLRSFVFPKFIVNPQIGLHWGRARGPFLNSGVNGTILGMIFMIGAFLMVNAKGHLPRLTYLMINGLLLVATYFTQTRLCWVGVAGGLGVVALCDARYRKYCFLGGVVLTVFVVTHFSTLMSTDRSVGGAAEINSVYERINLVVASLYMVLDKPVLGFGFDTFQHYSPEYFSFVHGVPYQGEGLVAHNTPLAILVELGLIGFCLLSAIGILVFKSSWRLIKRLPMQGFISKSLIVALWGIGTVFLIDIQFMDMRFFLLPNSLLFLFAGIIVGIEEDLKKDVTVLCQTV